ncbi:hypothetical protein [Maribacter sp. 2308TA10-17]|uniref:hypothetical protein n=1 Tax=Maribacter sp. 2308TA10-17 TaxID=3386276 RepID=UPI0039BC790D
MKVLPIVFLQLFLVFASAQDSPQDIIYLKDGGIIRGIILEQIPDVAVKIKIVGDNVLVYPLNEIEKVSKAQGSSLIGENNRRDKNVKGYLGFSVGVSIPLGDFGSSSNGLADIGIQVNGLNFGYLFSKHLGIATTLMIANNPNIRAGIEPWSYGSLLIGPLVSFPINQELTIDGRFQMGYAVATLPDLSLGKDTSTAIAYNAGIVGRYSFIKSFTLLLALDFLHTKPEFEDYGFKQNMKTISLGVGAAYSF